jgi:hypothetical protein
MHNPYGLHFWSEQHREMLLTERGRAGKRERKERTTMNESKFSVTRGRSSPC